MQRPRARPQVFLRGIFLRYERAWLPSSRLQALVMFRPPSSVAYLLALTFQSSIATKKVTHTATSSNPCDLASIYEGPIPIRMSITGIA